MKKSFIALVLILLFGKANAETGDYAPINCLVQILDPFYKDPLCPIYQEPVTLYHPFSPDLMDSYMDAQVLCIASQCVKANYLCKEGIFYMMVYQLAPPCPFYNLPLNVINIREPNYVYIIEKEKGMYVIKERTRRNEFVFLSLKG